MASVAAVSLFPAGGHAASPVVGANGTNGSSIGLNDTLVVTTLTTGLDFDTTDLTALAGVNNFDQISVSVNGSPAVFISINTGDTLQDLAAEVDAIDGVRATVTQTGSNDTMSITPEDVNTTVVVANTGGTPLSASGLNLPGAPVTFTPVSTPGGDGTNGGAAQASAAATQVFGATSFTGGAGGAGGTTAYNLAATDGGDGGDGGDGFLINSAMTRVELSGSSTVIAGGNGGAGGAGSGGGNVGSHGTGGIGIHLVGTGLGAVEIVNRGTVSGGLSGDGTTRNHAIYLENSGNTLKMYSGSALTGDVYLGTADGTLELDGSGTEDADFSGVATLSLTEGSSWTLSGDIDPNTGGLSIATASSSTLALTGTLSGDGLAKSGEGTLSISSTGAFSNGITVSGGALTVNGSAGAITLNGGTLNGSGTVGALTANSGSTVAPGNSIGTLNVTGNTSFAAGSTYAVEVDKDGNADKIAATGTVTIDSGATVQVSAENGTDDGSTYAPTTTYTILTGAAGVTGTFGSVSEDFAFLDAALGYGANKVTLELTRNASSFASAAKTANQRGAAGGVSSLGAGNAVYDAVVVLSEGDARFAFDSLSGEVHSSTNTLLIQQSSVARDAVGERIRGAFDSVASGDMPMIAFNGPGEAPAASGRAVAWGQAYGNWGRIGGDGNASTMDHSGGGMVLGADMEILGGWRTGVMAGYGNTSFDVDARASSGDAGSYMLGAYAGRQFGPLGLRMGANYTLHDVSTSRKVTAGTLTNTLSANYNAATAQLFGEAGYSFGTGAARFEPFAGVALLHQRSDAFTETGGASALSVDATSQTLGVTTLGLRTEWQVAAGDHVTASLSGSVGWSHVLGDPAATSTMRFATGDGFKISGTPLDRDTALVETGVIFGLGERARFDVSYHGELGEKSQNHGFNAKFSALF
ncbi:autotransporter domain-containing protein [uncultured Roseibium sp.]|uniref:autotransporter outer membrane beta-barrel domain-containing protein n=1 Tax=uncultured Roseibium sp. TaxID=1936171 RepID=UPI0026255D68|nr:autotransporter domain-containing protein [uncultured Roseibium sp.]